MKEIFEEYGGMVIAFAVIILILAIVIGVLTGEMGDYLTYWSILLYGD